MILTGTTITDEWDSPDSLLSTALGEPWANQYLGLDQEAEAYRGLYLAQVT